MRLLAPTGCDELRGRALGALFVAGGATALLTLLTGVDASVDRALIGALGAVAVAAGAFYVVLAGRLAQWTIGAGLAAALGLISAAVVASGEADAPYVLLYLWIAADAWFFLTPRAAAVLTASTLVSSAAAMTLAGSRGGDDLSWWLVLAATIAAVGALTGVLRLRAEALMDRLRADASHDVLTAVLNRRGFDDRLGVELARSARTGAPVSVVFADIDGFKAVNDGFSHAAGDAVLRRFAAVAAGQVRGVDAVARIGGEEFAFILPDTAGGNAVCVAERVRETVAATVCRPDGTPVTASFGVACFPADAAGADQLLARADAALYDAKRAGRNRTAAFSAATA